MRRIANPWVVTLRRFKSDPRLQNNGALVYAGVSIRYFQYREGGSIPPCPTKHGSAAKLESRGGL